MKLFSPEYLKRRVDNSVSRCFFMVTRVLRKEIKLKLKRYGEEEDKRNNECNILYERNGLYKAKRNKEERRKKEEIKNQM
jgi:hypothetical protein